LTASSLLLQVTKFKVTLVNTLTNRTTIVDQWNLFVMGNDSKRKRQSAKASRGPAAQAKQGILFRNEGIYLYQASADFTKSVPGLSKEVKNFLEVNRKGFEDFKEYMGTEQQEGGMVPTPVDENIQFGSVDYKDYRPYRTLYSIFDDNAKRNKMYPENINKLIETLNEELLLLYGSDSKKLIVTEVSLLAYGMTVQPYHQDDKAASPPKDNEYSIRGGSLEFNLSQEQCCLKVLSMGEGGMGYIAQTKTLSARMGIWFDDWVAHAGDQHGSACVRMHAHVDVASAVARKPKEVYLVTEGEIYHKYEQQRDFPKTYMKFKLKS
jgi:hypothetical protein